MSNTVYIINGDIDEISTVMDSVLKDNRFLSDTQNVKEFVWYPLTEGWQVAELSMLEPVDIKELLILSAEYTSLSIGITSTEGIVNTIIAEGIQEDVSTHDQTKSTR
jgi:hypothetical protein